MQLKTNELLDTFRQEHPDYTYVTDTEQISPGGVHFFPNQKPLVTPLLTFTAAVGLGGVFVAMLVISAIIARSDYFDGNTNSVVGNSGLIVCGLLLVAMLVVAVISRTRLRGKRRFLEDSAALRTNYRDGLYIVDEGLIFRDQNRIDTFPFGSIEGIDQTIIKRLFSNDAYRFQLRYLNGSPEPKTFFAQDSYYGLEQSAVWKKLAGGNIKIEGPGA
ncbi:MAG: hypothetical protein WBA12_08370 [Catalinimonas sp.]